MNKNILLIPILILISLFGFLIINNDSDKLALTNELKHLSHFLLKGDNVGSENEIVAVTKDNKLISIFKDDVSNIKYDYENTKLYLYFIKNNEGGFYYIDLTNNDFELNLIYKPINNVSNIQVYDQKIYFIDSGKIKYYDDYIKNLDLRIDYDIFYINKNKGLIIYNYENNIYEYSLYYEKTNLLFEDALIKLFANNKLLLTERVIASSLSSMSLQEYDYDTELVRRLGNPAPTGTILNTHHNLFPINNDYYMLGYDNRINIIKKDKSIDLLTILNYNTDTITDLGDNKIFTFTPSYQSFDSVKRIYDLTDESYVDVDFVYSNPLYIH